MEEIIVQQAELIAKLQDQIGDLTLERDEAREDYASTYESLKSARWELAEAAEKIEDLERDLKEIDITPQYRELYDRAAALLRVITGAEKPSQAECGGIDEAYQLSKWLDEFDL